MKMTSLQQLHRSMLLINSEMQQFQITFGTISFDCLFSTRDKPNYILSLTLRGENPKFFLFDVKKGYWIAPYFGDFYNELASVLRTGKNSGNKLMPKEFLDNLNKTIPTKATMKNNPKPSQIIRLRPDITEQRDRPHFDTWMYWKQSSGKGSTKEFLDNLNKTIPTKATMKNNPKPSQIIRLRPDITEQRDRPHFDTWMYWKQSSGKGSTKENRHKTLMVLGPEASDYSSKMNASSKWSAVDLNKSWIVKSN